MKTSSDSSFLVNYRSAKSSKDLRGVEENTYTCLKLELGMPVDDIGGLVMVMIRGWWLTPESRGKPLAAHPEAKLPPSHDAAENDRSYNQQQQEMGQTFDM